MMAQVMVGTRQDATRTRRFSDDQARRTFYKCSREYRWESRYGFGRIAAQYGTVAVYFACIVKG